MKYDKTALVVLGASVALLGGYFYLSSNEDKKKKLPSAQPKPESPATQEIGGGINPASTAWRPLSIPAQLRVGRRYRLRANWNVGASPEMESIDRLAVDSNYISYGGFNPFPPDWPELSPNSLNRNYEFTAVRDLSLLRMPAGVRLWERA